jgi:hypothetical protein
MMEPLTDERNRIRNYLLGVPEPDGGEELETRLLSDSDFLQQFSLVKDELMENYVSGTLSKDETTRFEEHFLSTPRRVLQVEVVKSLVNGRPVPVSNWSRYWPIAAVITVALLGGVFYLISKRTTLKGQQEQLSVVLAQLNDPRTVSSPTVSITLKQVYVRGPEERRVVANDPNGIILVQLEILGDTHENFRASLQTGEGVELGVVQNLKPETEGSVRVLKVKLPAAQLPSGSYQIKLDGLSPSGTYEAVGLYPFQVVKN